MALVAEEVTIDGEVVEVFKITGHPITDAIIVKSDLAAVDQARLILAASGEIKGDSNATTVGEDEYTLEALNILQAHFTDINKNANTFFSTLIKSQAEVEKRAALNGDLAQKVYDLQVAVAGLTAE